MAKYIEPKIFEDFCKNQKELVEILNHRMSRVEQHMSSIKTDVSWLKGLLWIIIGLVSSIFTTIVIKTLFGM